MPSSHLHHHHDIHQVLKRDKELEEKKRSEVAEVATLVREAGEGLLAKKWLVLHCNVFLKINSPNTRVLPAEVSFLSQLLHPISLPAYTHQSDIIIYPCPRHSYQVGLIKFSIECGLEPKDTFHAFPDPGELPV